MLRNNQPPPKTLSVPFVLIGAVLFFIALYAGCATAWTARYAKYSATLKPARGDSAIVFISDTQLPLPFERLWLHSDDNEKATEKLFVSIAGDSSCRAVFHLGDLTAEGDFASAWEKFDDLSKPVRVSHIPLYPEFGNHEYFPTAGPGKDNFLLRFPSLATSWYMKRVGSVGVILLNSNFSKLSKTEVRSQYEWYLDMLDSLGHDPFIKAIVVGCHHPPFTNSSVTKPSVQVEEQFAVPYLNSPKAKLFFSGHAHTYEHFRKGGKDFLVIGGGGGMLQPLLQGDSRRYQDLYSSGDERRFFHYARLTEDGDHLTLRIIALTGDHKNFVVADSMRVGM
jgi:hypothetical protein